MHDPRTPVLVGAGQVSERLGDPAYRALSPVELAAAAAAQAIAGLDPRAIDTVAAVRQFEISTPQAVALLGRSNNFPRSVAARIGADPKRAILDVTGGQSPQRLVTELAASIAAGESEAALVVGAEAISTIAHLVRSPDRPDFAEHVQGSLEDRGHGLDGLIDLELARHGLTSAAAQYALFENARRARLKQTRDDYAHGMGALFAPFTRIAARNPHAAAPTERTAEELVTVSPQNRMIADPYPRYVVAREKVNQAAAVLLMSREKARALGVPEVRWVHLHGHADIREQDILARPDLSRSPAAILAVTDALAQAGATPGDIAAADLYSCFPIAVSNITDAIPLTCPLTLTGGLPFFGGPGNDYSLHAIAEAVAFCRAHPGDRVLVGANGGLLTKYSVGLYATTPAPWTEQSDLQTQVDAWPKVESASEANGPATIETYTIRFSRDGRRTGIVIARLDDGRRFAATADPELLITGEPIGARIHARATSNGNRVDAAD
ncbi:acetyl-CoA acetyltransferase [Herbidospora mongoliensis]|uniref:acetyl-CoA acetyltransferase n=1 Tax=Herbidospora mongoliensis TaxID=688067 RepID=UPI0008340DC0|nr:acetyl-CoA acetyltransferase [Herbidospora mongoliensis]